MFVDLRHPPILYYIGVIRPPLPSQFTLSKPLLHTFYLTSGVIRGEEPIERLRWQGGTSDPYTTREGFDEIGAGDTAEGSW